LRQVYFQLPQAIPFPCIYSPLTQNCEVTSEAITLSFLNLSV
jgi:hypothetical protein